MVLLKKGDFSMWWLWLIAAGVFFIFEIATEGFLIFWLGLGSLLAMVTSFLTDSILIQTIVFVISSIALIFLTKPLVNKYMKNTKTIPTNSNALIGKTGIVTVKIDPLEATGQVKVNGEIWSAKTEGNTILEEHTKVKILKIDGVKLLVAPIKAEQTN